MKVEETEKILFPNLKYEKVERKREEYKVWIRYKGHGKHLGEG